MEKSYQEICSEIETLKKQAETARKREISGAISEARRLIRQYALTAADCGFTNKDGESKKTVVAVKYRHHENPALTWTGRGKAPTWLTTLEAQGQHRDQFRV